MQSLHLTIQKIHLASSHSVNRSRSTALPCVIGRRSVGRISASKLDSHSNKALVSSREISSIPTVLLKESRQSRAFRDGSQLIFSGAIQSIQPKTPDVADVVQVAVQLKDRTSVLGWGVYNPHSLYQVRILCHKYLQPQLERNISSVLSEHSTRESFREAIRLIMRHHVHTAKLARQALLDCKEETDTFRLINGEGDGLSGLSIDVIGDSVMVVMSSALWCEEYRDVIQNVLQESLPHLEIIWKSATGRLEQDSGGTFKTDAKVDLGESSTENGDVSVDRNKRVIYKENGVTFATYPFDTSQTQKTSVYCDQRENRLHIAGLSSNKKILDLCCYHAGFSLTALVKGNASYAVAVDSSKPAIQAAKENAELNNVAEDRIKFVQADVTTFLQSEFQAGSFYDVVVLDPPKLAPSTKSLDKARRKYHALNRDALKVVSPSKGGLLMTCTCSAAMTQKQDYFLNMVQGAALAAGRQVTLLRVSGAASCHTQSPISWPAGSYLTAALFYVHPE